ncbi:MAG TPA: hypothetical protein VLV87_06265 [Gammaproteobacteria bacterium]|nr:hypothetical protein [Gammaproteobacteria bacterium]
MRTAFTVLKDWGSKAFLRLKAAEEALDCRYEDYAQRRFDRLELRLTALEQHAAPGGGSEPASGR